MILRSVVFVIILNLSAVFSKDLLPLEDFPVMKKLNALSGNFRAVVAVNSEANKGWGHAALFLSGPNKEPFKCHLRLGHHTAYEVLMELKKGKDESSYCGCERGTGTAGFVNEQIEKVRIDAEIASLEQYVSKNPRHRDYKLRAYFDKVKQPTSKKTEKQLLEYNVFLGDGFTMTIDQEKKLKEKINLVLMKTNDEKDPDSKKQSEIDSVSFTTNGLGAGNCLTLIDWLFDDVSYPVLFKSTSYSSIPYIETKLSELRGLSALPYMCEDCFCVPICKIPACVEESSQLCRKYVLKPAESLFHNKTTADQRCLTQLSASASPPATSSAQDGLICAGIVGGIAIGALLSPTWPFLLGGYLVGGSIGTGIYGVYEFSCENPTKTIKRS